MSNKGNILLVANWESNVGYAWWLMENFWIVIAEHFKQGRTCYLIYPKITEIPQAIASTNIKITELDFSDHGYENLLRIFKFIKTNSIHYIYLSDYPTYSWFYLFLRVAGVKKIVVHDHTPGERTRPPYWLKITKSTIQHIPFYTADHFIAVTDFVNKRHLDINCIPAKKCSVATNGIQPYDLSHISSNYAHQEFNIPDNHLIIVTTGRASFYKGIDFFIRCANELINNQKLTRLHFLFCGNGPELDQFKALCNELKLNQHFTFAGKRTDIKRILPSCNIGFHAARGEVGYSLSILEYMSAGLATIVPDRPSTSNATRDKVTGLIYQHSNINSACNAIKLCLQDEFIEQLATHAIEEIKTHYNINKTNQQLTSILSNVYAYTRTYKQ